MSTQKEDVQGWLNLLARFRSDHLRDTATQLRYLSREEINDGSLSLDEGITIRSLAEKLESAADLMDKLQENS